ncbi:MAG: SMR family transporter [Pseudoxanthomonas sp.]
MDYQATVRTVGLPGYGISFYLLSRHLRTVAVGLAYAIRSGADIVLIALVDWRLLEQSLDAAAVADMTLILAG